MESWVIQKMHVIDKMKANVPRHQEIQIFYFYLFHCPTLHQLKDHKRQAQKLKELCNYS